MTTVTGWDRFHLHGHRRLFVWAQAEQTRDGVAKGIPEEDSSPRSGKPLPSSWAAPVPARCRIQKASPCRPSWRLLVCINLVTRLSLYFPSCIRFSHRKTFHTCGPCSLSHLPGSGLSSVKRHTEGLATCAVLPVWKPLRASIWKLLRHA